MHVIWVPNSTQEFAISSGRVKINGKPVKRDTLVKQHDKITHLVHRHEPPVVATPIKIIQESEDLLVIDKPPSMPVWLCLAATPGSSPEPICRCIQLADSDTTLSYLFLQRRITS